MHRETNTYKILVGKPQRKDHLGILDLGERGC